jgi:hypothetical protein
MPVVQGSDLAVIHFDAGHDRNGNPRRLYVVAHPMRGTLLAIDEGFEGSSAIDTHSAIKAVPGLGALLRSRVVGTFAFTAGKYRELLRTHASLPENLTIEI